MNDRLVRDIMPNMDSKATNELLTIWNENNRNQYTDETFEAVRRILSNRGHSFAPRAEINGIEGSQKAINQSTDTPWDEDSLKMFFGLPRRHGFFPAIISMSKLIAIPVILIGLYGFLSHILPVWKGGPAAEHAYANPGWFFFWMFITGGVLAAGGAMWYVHEHFTFWKAPLGDLACLMLEGINRRKLDKVAMAARSICLQTESQAESMPEVLFLRAFAFDIRAETTQSQNDAREMANKSITLAIALRERGINTPLLHFLLATCYRITKNRDKAIEFYKTYLSQRPNDEDAKRILASLLSPDFDKGSEPQLSEYATVSSLKEIAELSNESPLLLITSSDHSMEFLKGFLKIINENIIPKIHSMMNDRSINIIHSYILKGSPLATSFTEKNLPLNGCILWKNGEVIKYQKLAPFFVDHTTGYISAVKKVLK